MALIFCYAVTIRRNGLIKVKIITLDSRIKVSYQ